jgi:hypothetical protein
VCLIEPLPERISSFRGWGRSAVQFHSISSNPANNISLPAGHLGIETPRRTAVSHGVKIHYRRQMVIENDSISRILILDSKSHSSALMWTAESITALTAESLYEDREIEMIIFESETRLIQIGLGALTFLLLELIEIPRNVRISG